MCSEGRQARLLVTNSILLLRENPVCYGAMEGGGEGAWRALSLVILVDGMHY